MSLLLPLPASAVRVLPGPADFYARLLRIIREATDRVFLSSLYIASDSLVDALDEVLGRNTRLQLHLVLDYNRATRPGPDASVRALARLLRHGPRVRVSLFRSPHPVAAVAPPRFNEGWGTWHPKIYGADNDVIITGANLSRSYFTDRQDRYIHFMNQPALADYCADFLRLVSSFSYPLEDTLKDTVLLPLIQSGQFNIREEECTLPVLFNHLASPGAHVTWTSGYFGLYRPYQDMILKSPAACDVIAASPRANGFYGSRGLSGLIPEGYTLLEQRFMRAVDAARRLPDQCDHPVTLSEWERPDWTYHAKGIWLSPSRDHPPMMTMFGSTNLNSRSANLDTELSFIMITSSQTLQQSLHDEVRNLRRWANPWKGADRRVRWRTRAIVGLIGRML